MDLALFHSLLLMVLCLPEIVCGLEAHSLEKLHELRVVTFLLHSKDFQLHSKGFGGSTRFRGGVYTV